ncbi:hypothetical protein EAF04_008334 [Stromatinia cepivora]|nr:hypothetical protein EAF04_008334 [Stromatinia cepivora]
MAWFQSPNSMYRFFTTSHHALVNVVPPKFIAVPLDVNSKSNPMSADSSGGALCHDVPRYRNTSGTMPRNARSGVLFPVHGPGSVARYARVKLSLKAYVIVQTIISLFNANFNLQCLTERDAHTYSSERYPCLYYSVLKFSEYLRSSSAGISSVGNSELHHPNQYENIS